MAIVQCMILYGTFITLHTFPHVVKSRSRHGAAMWKRYLSQRNNLFSDLCWSKVKLAVCFQVLVRDLGPPETSLPDHQAEPQDIALHMTYRKGSRPDLSMICMSVFFFFRGVCVITDENQSMDVFPPRCTVQLFLLCGLPLQSPLVEHRGSLVLESRHNALSLTLSLYFLVFYSLVFVEQKTQGSLFYFGGLLGPQNNRCSTEERDMWVGLCNIIVCTSGPPKQCGATRANFNQKATETQSV